MNDCGDMSVGLDCTIDTTGPAGGYCAGHLAARSWHPGGVNALHCDGSVAFFDDGIDFAVWEAFATVAGEEVISN